MQRLSVNQPGRVASHTELQVKRCEYGVIQPGLIKRPFLKIVKQFCSLQGPPKEMCTEQERNLHLPGFCWCFTGLQLQRHWWDDAE